MKKIETKKIISNHTEGSRVVKTQTLKDNENVQHQFLLRVSKLRRRGTQIVGGLGAASPKK